MNALITPSKAAVVEAALGLRSESESIFFERLEKLYLQGVEDATLVIKSTHEKMEERINHLLNENAKLVALNLDCEVFNPEEIAHIRSLLTEVSDSGILKWMDFNPSIHQSVIKKLCAPVAPATAVGAA